VGSVSRMEKGEVHIGFWWGNLRETPRCRWEDGTRWFKYDQEWLIL